MTISRAAVRRVELPSEAVVVDGIGEVLVRGMGLTQWFEFVAEQRRASVPRDGETQEQATERAGGPMVTRVLAGCVVLDDGLPMWSLAEWEAFGALHTEQTMDLFKRVMRLSGRDTDAEKKS